MTTIIFSEVHFNAALHYASKKNEYTIDRYGMNPRPLSEKIDDKVMGDLAEIGVCLFLRNAGLVALTYDQIRTDNFSQIDPGWDVFVGINRNAIMNWVNNVQNGLGDIRNPPRELGKTISVKSSRLPKNDIDYNAAILIRDFKIFNNNQFNINFDLTADIEIQVYFPYQRTQLDRNILLNSEEVDVCAKQKESCQFISQKLGVSERYQDCFLAKWNYKDRIIQYSNSLPVNERTWSSFGKSMWIAPLRHGMDLTELVYELENRLKN